MDSIALEQRKKQDAKDTKADADKAEKAAKK